MVAIRCYIARMLWHTLSGFPYSPTVRSWGTTSLVCRICVLRVLTTRAGLAVRARRIIRNGQTASMHVRRRGRTPLNPRIRRIDWLCQFR